MRRELVICIALAAATLAVYWPVRTHDFLRYDDPEFVTENAPVRAGLNSHTLAYALTATPAANWHPVTTLSHALDCHLFHLNAGSHLLVNVALHIANTLLLFFLLKRMTGATWRSAVVASLFALHPLRVESVAWIAERKDVLSGLFFMLTLLAYARYVEGSRVRCQVSGAKRQVSGVQDRKERRPNPEGQGPKEGRNPKSEIRNPHSEVPQSEIRNPHSQDPASHIQHPAFYYILCLVFFALGLMSKPMLVTLPFVLLLLDYWPLRRISFPPSFHHSIIPSLRLLFEKLPFLALSIACSVVTFVTQRRSGAVPTLAQMPLELRFGNMSMAYLLYLKKLVWPSDLAVLYQIPDDWPLEQVGIAVLALAVITLLALGCARRRPYLAAGWLWHLGMLVPVIGLVQVGNQFMADRYTYLPLVGCFIMLAWGGHELAERVRLPKAIQAALALLALGLAAVLAGKQVGYWKNTDTVFEHCIAVTTANYVARNTWGADLWAEGKVQEAKAQFREALRIKPNHVEALKNLSTILAGEGRAAEAFSLLGQLVRVRPDLASLYGSLGLTLDLRGATEAAVPYYRECLRRYPDDAGTCNNLAWLLATHPDAKLRDGVEAVRLAEHACQLTGYRQAPVVGTLAAAYAESGRFTEAATSAEQAAGLALAASHKELAARNRRLRELYLAGKPYHEAAQPLDP